MLDSAKIGVQSLFKFGVSLDPTTSPLAVAVGDFTGSGQPETALLSLGPFTNGLFQSKVDIVSESGALVAEPLPIPGEATALAVGDFNGDGSPDLVVASHGPFNPDTTKDFTFNSVSVFLNDGHGKFAASETLTSLTLPGEPVALAAGHFFGNARTLDLAVATRGLFDSSGQVFSQDRVSLAKGDGMGSFTIENSFALKGGENGLVPLSASNLSLSVEKSRFSGDGLFGLAAGDFNRDGRDDLALALDPVVAGVRQETSAIQIQMNTGNGMFHQMGDSLAVPTADPVSLVALAGSSLGDGRIDLAVGDRGPFAPGSATKAISGTFPSSTVTVLQGDGQGSFSMIGTVSGGGDLVGLTTVFSGTPSLEMLTSDSSGSGGIAAEKLLLIPPPLPPPLTLTGDLLLPTSRPGTQAEASLRIDPVETVIFASATGGGGGGGAAGAGNEELDLGDPGVLFAFQDSAPPGGTSAPPNEVPPALPPDVLTGADLAARLLLGGRTRARLARSSGAGRVGVLQATAGAEDVARPVETDGTEVVAGPQKMVGFPYPRTRRRSLASPGQPLMRKDSPAESQVVSTEPVPTPSLPEKTEASPWWRTPLVFCAVAAVILERTHRDARKGPEKD